MSMKVFCWCTRDLSEVGHRGMDNGGSVDNRGSVDHGSSVDDGTGNGNRVGNGDSLGVDSLAVVSDSGDVSLNVVGSVGDVLGATVREGNGVRSSPGSSAVVSLGSLEVGAGVVVGNGVLVLVGGDLVRVHLGNSVGNRGSVDDRSSVDDRASNSVGNAVSDNSVGKSSSQKLRGGGGRSNQGHTKESLHFCCEA